MVSDAQLLTKDCIKLVSSRDGASLSVLIDISYPGMVQIKDACLLSLLDLLSDLRLLGLFIQLSIVSSS